MINISFEGEPLHEICIDLSKAEQAYGSIAAGALVAFISDAQALETVDELIELLGGDIIIFADDSLSVAIGSDHRATLVVVGRHKMGSDGRIVWSSVTRLKLLKIARVP
ncbi:hypothetical protein [Beijerinckia indica]|uniref:Uncharacterized protein n=1 Tax=Beijerinckia indica subsp. indica (strain ATCC 9039 / DSM 1715 / NCIMB 8712) TaxID=395963 RepID=B2IB91_BEII9|nr:hypothetical protein [Beijerinckia indica]ACB95175.1 hypothetical protein Bind_1542 [Beijerinckia indica subsp. indica ATCC 9039]